MYNILTIKIFSAMGPYLTCITDVMSGCGQEVEDLFNKIMGGIRDAMNYMCTTGKQGEGTFNTSIDLHVMSNS